MSSCMALLTLCLSGVWDDLQSGHATVDRWEQQIQNKEWDAFVEDILVTHYDTGMMTNSTCNVFCIYKHSVCAWST